MKGRMGKYVGVTAVVLLLVTAGLTVAGRGYELAWFSMDGGGGYSEGGTYAVSGTIGQTDTNQLEGKSYSVQGGFWQAQSDTHFLLYLPIIVKMENEP